MSVTSSFRGSKGALQCGRRASLVAWIVVSMTLVVHGATRKVDFSDDAVGQAPKGFEFGHTAKAGAPGKWVVQAEGSNKYLAQVDPDNTRSRFPVAVVSDVTAADVDLSARFRPVSGRVDQAAGLVWRFQNEDNYYIVRANALENNVVLYKVEKGKRTDLPVKGEGRTYGKKAQVPVGTMEHAASGRGRAAVRSVLQRQQALRGRGHARSRRPGKVGLWTKADSVTQFDDLTIVTK